MFKRLGSSRIRSRVNDYLRSIAYLECDHTQMVPDSDFGISFAWHLTDYHILKVRTRESFTYIVFYCDSETDRLIALYCDYLDKMYVPYERQFFRSERRKYDARLKVYNQNVA